jgi:hypothetical protein
MPSANQNPLKNPTEFMVDTTERTATLAETGGFLLNTGTTDAVVNPNGTTTNQSTITASQPAGSGMLRIPCAQGAAGAAPIIELPRNCSSFNFKSTGTTYLQYFKSKS